MDWCLILKSSILDAPKHKKVVCPSHNHMQWSARKTIASAALRLDQVQQGLLWA